MTTSRQRQVSVPEVWEARLTDFLHDCVSSPASEEENRIREGAGLLLRLGVPGSRRIDPAAIEAMLACGAGESAVLEIIGRDAAFMASRGAPDADGTACLVTLLVPGGSEEAVAEAETLALALLAAHVASLLQQFENSGCPEGTDLAQAPVRLH